MAAADAVRRSVAWQGSEDIREQLPEDAKRFDGIDASFKEQMGDASATLSPVDACLKDGRMEALEACRQFALDGECSYAPGEMGARCPGACEPDHDACEAQMRAGGCMLHLDFMQEACAGTCEELRDVQCPLWARNGGASASAFHHPDKNRRRNKQKGSGTSVTALVLMVMIKLLPSAPCDASAHPLTAARACVLVHIHLFFLPAGWGVRILTNRL